MQKNDSDNTNYRKDVIALLDRQDAKGMSKYGHPLEQSQAEILERLNHLAEELADALRYICWCMEVVRGGYHDKNIYSRKNNRQP